MLNTDGQERSLAAARGGACAPEAGAYERPRVVTLGSLTELTLGGNDGGPSDAMGGAGLSASY
jgi:hypothetical protein